MKLLLVLVSIIAVFTADGQDSGNNQVVLQATNEDQLRLEGAGRHSKTLSSVKDEDENEIQDEDEQEHQQKEGKEQRERKLKGSRCKARNACVVMGGFCVTNATLCSGRLVPEGCKGTNCQCCVPGTIEAKFDNFEKELHYFNVNMNSSDTNLQSEIQSLKVNLNSELQTIHENMRSEMQSLKESANISNTDLGVDFQTLKDNMNLEMHSLKDVANISNSDLSEDFQSLKDNMNSEMQSLKDNINTALANLTSKIDHLMSKGSLIIPTKTTTKMNWSDAVKRCRDMGAEPFIPRTSDDFQLYNSTRRTLGNYGYMWLPASDISVEGTLRWTNGEYAPSSSPGLLWSSGRYMRSNSASNDCLFYGSVGSGGVHMWPCSRTEYPMICRQN